MLSNACARRHMHKFGSFTCTGKVTENRSAKTTLLIITPAYLRLRSSSLALEIAQPELSSGRDSAFNGSAFLRNPREPTLHVRRVVRRVVPGMRQGARTQRRRFHAVVLNSCSAPNKVSALRAERTAWEEER